MPARLIHKGRYTFAAQLFHKARHSLKRSLPARFHTCNLFQPHTPVYIWFYAAYKCALQGCCYRHFRIGDFSHEVIYKDLDDAHFLACKRGCVGISRNVLGYRFWDFSRLRMINIKLAFHAAE